jgi:predicted N-acetyltransferase YhbS
MADWRLRMGTRDDVPHLAAIERAADGLFPAGRLPPGDETYPVQDLIAACDAGLLFVAAVAERVVGFAYCAVAGRDLHLAGLAVLPDFGRRGIGAALIRRVVEAAGARGLGGVTLPTFADIPWNAPFYERLGLRRVDDAAALPHLAEALAREDEAGMTGRIAMRLPVGSAD